MAGSAPDQVHLHGGAWEKQTVRKLAPAPGGPEGEVREGLGKLFAGGGGAEDGTVEKKEKKKKDVMVL